MGTSNGSKEGVWRGTLVLNIKEIISLIGN